MFKPVLPPLRFPLEYNLFEDVRFNISATYVQAGGVRWDIPNFDMAATENHATGNGGDTALADYLEESKVIQDAPKIALEAVQGIGLFSAVIDEQPMPLLAKRTIASWCCIFGMKHHFWIDMMIEAEKEGAEAVFKELTGSVASGNDAEDLLGEIANYIRGGMRKGMSALGEETLIPGTPKEVPGGNIHTVNHYHCPKICVHLKANDFRLVVTFLIHKQTPVAKTLGALRERDISLESIPTVKGSTLEVLAKGVVLSTSWIEKLRNRFMKEATLRKILVVTPPSLTSLFHPNF